MSNSVLIINGIDERGERLQLARLEGFDVSVYVDNTPPSFPYRIGDRFAIKVYDPERRVDCDNDTRAWRTDFVMTKIQILDGAIYGYGFSYGREFTALSTQTCEDNHLPWEHDGTCYYTEPKLYHGPVEVQFFQWGEEKPLCYQFDTVLGGAIDKTGELV